MTKILSDAQDAQYHDEGFLAPLGLVSEADADQLYRNFQSLEQNCEGDVSQRFRIKAHLPFPWLCETRFDGATAMVLRGPKLPVTGCPIRSQDRISIPTASR